MLLFFPHFLLWRLLPFLVFSDLIAYTSLLLLLLLLLYLLVYFLLFDPADA